MKKLEIIRRIVEEDINAKTNSLLNNSDILNLTILANINKNNLIKKDLNFLLKYDEFLVWDSTIENDFEEYADFLYINYHPRGILISKYPELINKTPSNIFDKWDWARIISYQPELISKYKKVNDLDCFQWALILKRQPQLINKCNKLDLFEINEICNIVAHQPSLISILPSNEKINQLELAILIRNRPEFIEELNIDLDKLTNKNWAIILEKQPQLINKCSIIKDLTPDNLVTILSKQPQLSIKCKKFKSFKGMYWSSLLIKQPIFLDLYIKYKDKYELEMNTITKCKIVFNHPELAEKFVNDGIPEFKFISNILFSKQSKENRLNILEKYNKYIKKTNTFTDLIGIYPSKEMKELYTKKDLWKYVDFNKLTDNLEYSILK